jgi:predicted nuclease of predicted toxin-antitoxin system
MAWPTCSLAPATSNQLDCASDDQVWEHARQNGFAIVTKDEDYDFLSVLRGSPPKVIWLQLGNCTTSQVEAVLRARFADIAAFEQVPSVGTLVIS